MNEQGSTARPSWKRLPDTLPANGPDGLGREWAQWVRDDLPGDVARVPLGVEAAIKAEVEQQARIDRGVDFVMNSTLGDDVPAGTPEEIEQSLRDFHKLLDELNALNERSRAERAEEQVRVLREALTAIRDYDPWTRPGGAEVIYDEFAYRRIVESYRAAARAALGMESDVGESQGVVES